MYSTFPKKRVRATARGNGVLAEAMVLAFLAGADFAFHIQSDASSFTMEFEFFLGMIGSALIVAGAHLPRPEAASTTETASR